jgi:hypothetical protein
MNEMDFRDALWAMGLSEEQIDCLVKRKKIVETVSGEAMTYQEFYDRYVRRDRGWMNSNSVLR